MKKRDDTVYLNDILDAIGQIETYLEGIPTTVFGKIECEGTPWSGSLRSLARQVAAFPAPF